MNTLPNPRVLPLEGIHNFRDYGGYDADGGKLKSATLWRSGQHVDATEGDLATLEALNLRDVIDFRGASEREKAPCRRASGFDAELHYYAGETAGLAPHIEAAKGVMNEAGAMEAMERAYASLPTREPVLWVMRRFFAILAEGRGASLVHCLAGKDRTGMAVYLFHHAMGVHADDAMADYLLTNSVGNIEARIAAGSKAIRAKYGAISDGTIRVLMGVDASYILAMVKAVEAEHGTLGAFLTNVLGVDDDIRAHLRAHYLEG